MAKRQLTRVCIALLLLCSLAESQPQAPSVVNVAGLKERLTLIPVGSIIEVQLMSKQKIRGRLGALTDSGFELQHAGDGKIVTEIVAFDSVKSVKVVGKDLNFAAKVIIGTLIAGGVAAAIGGIIFATSEK
jgi:hypothetical protein